MAGAFLTAARRPSPGAAGPLSAADAAKIDADVERARHVHSCARMMLTDGLRPLDTAWHFSDEQVGLVREQFSRVVGSLAAEAETASRPRWRLRRSTHIGGIATDHGATARAARSTPRALSDFATNEGADTSRAN